jgi:hypothetical protein
MLLHGQLSGASFDDLKQEFTALTTEQRQAKDVFMAVIRLPSDHSNRALQRIAFFSIFRKRS